MKRNSAITEEDADELKDEFASFVERIRKFTPAASISDDPYEINTKKKYQKMMGGTIGRWQEKQQAETAQLLWGDEAEKADFTKRLQEFQDSDPNDENFRIPPLLFTKIKNIVENPEIRRYTTVDEFMSDALELFTTWWTTPQKSAELMTAMWPDMTMQMKHEVKEKAPQFYEQMEAANQPKNLTTLQPNENAQQGAKWKKITVNADVKGNGGSVTKILDHQILNRVDSTMDDLKRLGDTASHFPLQISKERLKYDGYPLVWEFYTRFFPAKIALIALSHMVKDAIDTDDKILDQFVDFDEFQSKAYNLAVGLSHHIR